MPGVPGAGGPPPKRESHRRRTNQPALGEATKAPAAKKVRVPTADRTWHPVAKQLYNSLKQSGQAAFMEPSDWGTAWVLCESISREMKPQPIGNTEAGEPIMAELPPKGASLAAWLKALSLLMATEGDRRRLRLELERPAPSGAVGEGASVSHIDDIRRRLGGTG